MPKTLKHTALVIGMALFLAGCNVPLIPGI